MLTNNRRAFKFDNIRKCPIVQSNFTGKQLIIFIFKNNLNII
ncbi:CGG triplet repeat-binding protein 1 [Aphis craccivora]|uniref:CGG triplet repeat-binding protein 1 n=1 Tax=Aphis craccivora TaxID=307492 RepID=A0A6G0Y7Z6_APHCR|nr:CGG triplet repeat-binding protein 1 [Aphis craccivora]